VPVFGCEIFNNVFPNKQRLGANSSKGFSLRALTKTDISTNQQNNVRKLYFDYAKPRNNSKMLTIEYIDHHKLKQIATSNYKLINPKYDITKRMRPEDKEYSFYKKVPSSKNRVGELQNEYSTINSDDINMNEDDMVPYNFGKNEYNKLKEYRMEVYRKIFFSRRESKEVLNNLVPRSISLAANKLHYYNNKPNSDSQSIFNKYNDYKEEEKYTDIKVYCSKPLLKLHNKGCTNNKTYTNIKPQTLPSLNLKNEITNANNSLKDLMPYIIAK